MQRRGRPSLPSEVRARNIRIPRVEVYRRTYPVLRGGRASRPSEIRPGSLRDARYQVVRRTVPNQWRGRTSRTSEVRTRHHRDEERHVVVGGVRASEPVRGRSPRELRARWRLEEGGGDEHRRRYRLLGEFVTSHDGQSFDPFA
jgi:hypothetical protein